MQLRHILLITGGKGGVGKSTLAAAFARSIAASGRSVGILDADLTGPSQALLFDAPPLKAADGRITPSVVDGVQIVSLGAVAQPETALVWAPAVVRGTLRALSQEASWADLDLLVVDMPPGIGSVHHCILDVFPSATAILVTTGSPLAIADCRRELAFYRRLRVPILGIVENLAYYRCTECGAKRPMYAEESVPTMVSERSVVLIARLPWTTDLQSTEEFGELVRRSDAWFPA